MALNPKSEPTPRPEVWLRGPITDVPALLQPVAHALLQAVEEVEALMVDFPQELLWARPGEVASVGFHLQHLAGILDRLFTYARGESLDARQLKYLSQEGTEPTPAVAPHALVTQFQSQVDQSLKALRSWDESMLFEARVVGRGRLPSTVVGLLVHAAEHTQRHVGQLLVTARIQQKSC